MLTSSGNYHNYMHSSGSWGTASLTSSLEASDGGLGVHSSYGGGRTPASSTSATTTTNCKDLKVALVGKGGSGKSALVVRFLTGRFLHCYNPTLEDTYQKSMRVDGENYNLSILDTAGQDDIHFHYYIKYADILLIAFAINDQSSLSKARQIKMLADISSRGSQKVPVVLVGCKGDTPRDVGSNAELGKLARDMECSYVETSSAEGRNCALPFRTAIKLFNCTTGCNNGSDVHSSPDHKGTGHRRSAIVRKCRNFLGINHPSTAAGGRQDYSGTGRGIRNSRSHTPEPITITVSMEY